MSGGSGEIYYPQSEHEKNYFNYLWDIANNRPPAAPGAVDLTGELSGLAAVTFFQRSGVDKGFLKQIWSLSTPAATMNLHQFYVALRFIAMIQNGEMPISKERLLATAKEKFELPKFNGVDMPRPVALAATIPPVAPVANAGAAFAITPQEHVKYHSLFASYDKDRDGFLSREEAIPVLRQSGLDPVAVDQIWSIADDDRDNRFTSKEFCAAFHIIVCVSKRGQPLPPAMPPSLKMFLLNAPAIPGEGIPAGVPPVATAHPPSIAVAPSPVSVPGPGPIAVEAKKQDISSAFSALDDHSHTSTTTASNNAEDADIRNSLDAMKVATKKTLAAHEQAVEIGSKTYSSLSGIKQRLATDRIALEATVANAVLANNECNAKLEQVTAEISQLQDQIRQLSLRLQETSQNTSYSQGRLAKAQEEKQQLLKEIDQLLRQLDQTQSDSLQITDKLMATEREASRLEAENKALSQSSASLKTSLSELSRENDELRRIAASLRERSSSAINNRQNLATRATLAADKVQSQQISQQQLQRQVQIDTQQLESLREEKKALLGQIASNYSEKSENNPENNSVSAFDEVSLDFPSTRTVASASAITTGTFDDSDDPFGGFDTPDPGQSQTQAETQGFSRLREEEAGSFSPSSFSSSQKKISDTTALSPPSTNPTTATAANPTTTTTAKAVEEDPFGDSPFDNQAPSPPSKPPKVNKAKKPEETDFEKDPFSDFPSESSPITNTNTNTAEDRTSRNNNSSNSNAMLDDPFAGFDDNVPLPSASTGALASSSIKSSNPDPFSDFNEETKAPAEDPFSAASTGFGDDKDPFAAFDDHKEDSSDPFASFGAGTGGGGSANSSSKGAGFGADDGFGSAGFGGHDEDPFGSAFDSSQTQQLGQKKTVESEEDDPFAGFD